jgi:hypothetical protein
MRITLPNYNRSPGGFDRGCLLLLGTPGGSKVQCLLISLIRIFYRGYQIDCGLSNRLFHGKVITSHSKGKIQLSTYSGEIETICCLVFVLEFKFISETGLERGPGTASSMDNFFSK